MRTRVGRRFGGVWGIGAVLGGILWASKSLAILITGDQPEYIFELAPIALAVAALGLALAWRKETRGTRLPTLLTFVALLSTTSAGVSYLVRRDDEGLFGPALMVGMVSIIVVLFWVGRSFWRTRASDQWRAIPFPLAWSFVIALPLSGALGALNERLLEIPLLTISLGWIWLGVAWLASEIKGKRDINEVRQA